MKGTEFMAENSPQASLYTVRKIAGRPLSLLLASVLSVYAVAAVVFSIISFGGNVIVSIISILSSLAVAAGSVFMFYASKNNEEYVKISLYAILSGLALRLILSVIALFMYSKSVGAFTLTVNLLFVLSCIALAAALLLPELGGSLSPVVLYLPAAFGLFYVLLLFVDIISYSGQFNAAFKSTFNWAALDEFFSGAEERLAWFLLSTAHDAENIKAVFMSRFIERIAAVAAAASVSVFALGNSSFAFKLLKIIQFAEETGDTSAYYTVREIKEIKAPQRNKKNAAVTADKREDDYEDYNDNTSAASRGRGGNGNVGSRSARQEAQPEPEVMYDEENGLYYYYDDLEDRYYYYDDQSGQYYYYDEQSGSYRYQNEGSGGNSSYREQGLTDIAPSANEDDYNDYYY
ncbi:MAG: hypothetical protein LBL82_04395 [Oscillospiraceae bacterium]|jgi:hypothetical protein|nr:hypothetical protein [Oscillospiraceae bacterium]